MSCESKDSMLAYLIGALADGSLYHNKKHYVHRVSYYQQSREYLVDCIEPRIMQLFAKKGHFYFDRRKNVYYYEITSKRIFLSFKKAIESFKSESNRRIPSWIRNGENSIGIAFVRGFFDADGFYYASPEKADYRVRFGQSEYFILKDLKELLSHEFKCSDVLGPYQSKIGAKPYYELHIHGLEQVSKFQEQIRPCHPHKQWDGII
ncbi:MAG: LAGLIDADG family homing endonuclease [Candidatus Hodarchaeota archaeon]